MGRGKAKRKGVVVKKCSGSGKAKRKGDCACAGAGCGNRLRMKQMLDRMLDCDASLRAVAASKKGCPPPHTGNCVAIVPKTSYARIDELQNKGKYCHTLGEATTLGVGQLQALVVTTLERASIEPSFVASYDASLDGAKTLAEMRQNRFKAGECTAISHSLRFPGLC
jgi:hypothetical protein